MRKTVMTLGLLAYGAWYVNSAHAQTTNTVEVPLPIIPVLNDPYFPLQWSHMNTGTVPNFPGTGTCGTIGFDLNIPETWEYMNTQKVEEIRVGVLDSGLDPGHPDLNPNRLLPGRNFAATPYNFNTTDTYGHGTHVLGAIAATENNNIGIAGVDRTCSVMPLKIDPTVARDQRTHIADAIRYAVNNNVKVINMSWGWSEVTIDNGIRDAISYGIAHGCTFVGAVGNYNSENVDFPAKVGIAVGAANPCGMIKTGNLPLTCELDSRTIYGIIWGSNYGTGLDIMGPGTMLPAIDIQGASGLSSYTNCGLGTCYTPGLNGDYVTNAFGTSIASPYITGIVSQMLAVNTQLKMHEAEYLLKAASTPMPGGYKWANAYQAVYLASLYTPGSHPLADIAVDQVQYQRINQTTVQATVTVSNRSTTVASVPTQLYVYSSRTWINDVHDIAGSSATMAIPAIPPGGIQTYTLTFPYDDNYDPNFHKLWLNAIVDPGMLLEETDEANNARCVQAFPGQTFTEKNGDLTEELSESREPRLELFPNPAKEQVTVAVELTGNGRVLLTDLLGNRLYERELTAGGNQQLLVDTGHLSSGIYMVELQTAGKRVLAKLVIR